MRLKGILLISQLNDALFVFKRCWICSSVYSSSRVFYCRCKCVTVTKWFMPLPCPCWVLTLAHEESPGCFNGAPWCCPGPAGQRFHCNHKNEKKKRTFSLVQSTVFPDISIDGIIHSSSQGTICEERRHHDQPTVASRSYHHEGRTCPAQISHARWWSNRQRGNDGRGLPSEQERTTWLLVSHVTHWSADPSNRPITPNQKTWSNSIARITPWRVDESTGPLASSCGSCVPTAQQPLTQQSSTSNRQLPQCAATTSARSSTRLHLLLRGVVVMIPTHCHWKPRKDTRSLEETKSKSKEQDNNSRAHYLVDYYSLYLII